MKVTTKIAILITDLGLSFLDEMFQTKKKFYAGTTAIDALKNIKNYFKLDIKSIEFEGKIIEESEFGHRFDIKIITNKKKVFFIETKNYGNIYIFSGESVFKQLKVYLKALGKDGSFDQIVYVVQDRKIPNQKSDVIRILKEHIARDAEAAYNANGDLWKTVDVFGPEDLSLEALNANKKFNDAIKNCIKLTD